MLYTIEWWDSHKRTMRNCAVSDPETVYALGGALDKDKSVKFWRVVGWADDYNFIWYREHLWERLKIDFTQWFTDERV
jgi:hypothetical protein